MHTNHIHRLAALAVVGVVTVLGAHAAGAAIAQSNTATVATVPVLVVDSDRFQENGGPIPPTVTDTALCTNFQGPDFMNQAFAKGRALITADFDLDGRLDVYVGNPGDQTFVARSVEKLDDPECDFEFELVQEFHDGEFAWTAAAADYDNDGDYDIVEGCGGNESSCDNYLWQNQWIESGETELSFVDVTEEAGIATWGEDLDIDGDGVFGETKTTSGVDWADFNNDGWVDLFVGGNVGFPNPDKTGKCSGSDECGRNTLWQNNGDGTFTDVTEDVGLIPEGFYRSRHNSSFDADNDGDMDIYEVGYQGRNTLWRNLFVENGGELAFEDATVVLSATGTRLTEPFDSFGSCVADFNNDGRADILVSARGPRGDVTRPGEELHMGVQEGTCGDQPCFQPKPADAGEGHALFINTEDGFENIADESGLNDSYEPIFGVMGFQMGDLNGDGVPDVNFVHGAPRSGQYPSLAMSDRDAAWGEVVFNDKSKVINFPNPINPEVGREGYPDEAKWRGHGTTFADIDNDGQLEILNSNGGAVFPAPPPTHEVREPNRLLDFEWHEPFSHMIIRPVGDGVNVSRDGIGTKVAVTVTDEDGERTIYRTLYGSSCFSAHNGFELYFGLGYDPLVTVDSVEVTWMDGTVETVTEDLAPNTEMVITYGETNTN